MLSEIDLDTHPTASNELLPKQKRHTSTLIAADAFRNRSRYTPHSLKRTFAKARKAKKGRRGHSKDTEVYWSSSATGQVHVAIKWASRTSRSWQPHQHALKRRQRTHGRVDCVQPRPPWSNAHPALESISFRSVCAATAHCEIDVEINDMRHITS